MNKIYFSILLLATIAVSSYGQETVSDASSSDAILTQFQNICIEKTGNAAYGDIIKDALERNRFCLDRAINRTEIGIQASILVPQGRISEVYEGVCAKRTAAMQCFHNEATVYDACLTQQQIVDKTIALKVINEVMGYACEKQTEILGVMRYVMINGPVCSDETLDEAKECFTTHFAKHTAQNPLIPSTFVNAETCGDLKAFKTCVIPVFQKCKKTDVATLVSGLIDTIKTQVSCPHDGETNAL